MRERDSPEEGDLINENELEVLSNFSNSAGSGHMDSIDSNERKPKYFPPSLSLRSRHKASVELSEFRSETEQFRLQEFFDDEIILDHKVSRKDVCFKSKYLSHEFTREISDHIYKFAQAPSEYSFFSLLEEILLIDTRNILWNDEMDGQSALEAILEDLFYYGKNQFLIFSFDWFFCHLSFVTCLLLYWVRVDVFEADDDTRGDSPKSTQREKQRVFYIRNQQKKIKENLVSITRTYAE